MARQKVLFIGGTGLISSACARRAVACGWDLHLLTRGSTTPAREGSRAIPQEATFLHGDAGDADSLRAALADHHFDAVVDFIAFTPEQTRTRIDALAGRTRQYVLISTASVYQNPPRWLPLTESTPLRNDLWDYGRDKIACEEEVSRAYRERDFPGTIVRPSHTFDAQAIPIEGGWTVVDRMRRGLEVVVHGDGSSLWPLTHHDDFAVGLVGLLGERRAIGHAFHVTTDEALTWDQIFQTLAEAAGVDAPKLVHVTSDAIAAADTSGLQGHAAFWGAVVRGGKSHSLIFDNSKVKALVPEFRGRVTFAQAAREIVEWHDADPARQVVDEAFNALSDRLIDAYRPRPL